MKWLKESLNRSSYQPNLFSLIFNPFHTARNSIFKAINTNAPQFTGTLLDVGCGGKPYESLFKNISQYTGLDIDQPRNRERNIANDYYDGTLFPYEDNSFNGILCSQVLEHVFEPDQFLSELFRVLKPGGRIVLTVPFVWDEHEQPWDYTRYTSFGLKSLFEKHGFTVQQQEKLNSGAPALLQLSEGFIYKKIQKLHCTAIGKVVFGITLFFPLNLLASASQLLKKSDADFYLDNLIIAVKE